jgi:predicted O-methyltransferase YrrM
MTGARTALEIGTLGGYSTIWIASALPDDGPARYAGAERQARRGRARERRPRGPCRQGRGQDRRGARDPAEDRSRGARPIRFHLHDTDKANNAAYLEWALRLSRPGTAIVVDNVVRDGEVADPRIADADVVGVRRMFELIAREPRLSATAIQTVGSKGWDGFALALVK